MAGHGRVVAEFCDVGYSRTLAPRRTDSDLVDLANTGLGHRQVQRWNLPAGWRSPPVMRIRRWSGAGFGKYLAGRRQRTGGSTATGSRWACWWLASRGVARTAFVRSSSVDSDSRPLVARTVSRAVSQCS